MVVWSVFISNAVLSALSISNLGLISSMVGFLHHEKDHVKAYEVAWPGNTIQLAVEPKHLWTDQGHESNGVAGYGFFLGLYGLFVAWRLGRRTSNTFSKNLLALAILQLLAVLFTLSAIIFVFLVTNQTKGQQILPDIARSYEPYPADKWTPETWFKAVLDLPLVSQSHRDNISSKVTNMVVWRWMLIPIFLADIVALSVSALEIFKQRKGAREPEFITEK